MAPGIFIREWASRKRRQQMETIEVLVEHKWPACVNRLAQFTIVFGLRMWTNKSQEFYRCHEGSSNLAAILVIPTEKLARAAELKLY